MQKNKTNEIELLKSQIGFGTAFKATLGFYAAQFVAQIVGLVIVVAVIAGVILLVSSHLHAEEPPPFLKDGKIEVTLKDGHKAHFSSNEWKVVPRVDHPKVAPAPKTVVIEKPELNNRVRVLGGVGPQGYHLKQSSSEIDVSNRSKVVTGLGYERKLTHRFSLGGEAISNGTYTLDLGLDF